MPDIEADFIINDENPIEAEYSIDESKHFDCSFELNINPSKVSQLENDLNFQTKTEVDNAIAAESEIINTRIDNEVERLEEEISQSVITVEGSALIDVSKDEQTVTISSKTFVFEQGIASDTWVINHNLNKKPSIILTTSSGEVFEAARDYISANQVIIRLEAADTGYAYLN